MISKSEKLKKNIHDNRVALLINYLYHINRRKFSFFKHSLHGKNMMTDTIIGDPYDMLFGDDLNSLSSGDLLFSNEIMFTDFNNHSQSTSPVQATTITNEITGSNRIFSNSLFIFLFFV